MQESVIYSVNRDSYENSTLQSARLSTIYLRNIFYSNYIIVSVSQNVALDPIDPLPDSSIRKKWRMELVTDKRLHEFCSRTINGHELA